MTNNDKIVLTVAAVYVGLATKNILAYRRLQAAKRYKLQTDTIATAADILAASERLQAKVRSGQYRITSIEQIRTDIEFEIIAMHNEK